MTFIDFVLYLYVIVYNYIHEWSIISLLAKKIEFNSLSKLNSNLVIHWNDIVCVYIINAEALISISLYDIFERSF